MLFQTFKDEVCKAVTDYYGEEVTVSMNQVKKNNGVSLDGMVITRDQYNVSPTIYLNDFFKEYEHGRSMSSIVMQLVEMYEKNKIEKRVDMDFFLQYELVKNKIAFKLINYEKNKELLTHIPHIKYLDLAIVFYCLITSEEFHSASILVYHSHLDLWKVSEETIFLQAKENTPRLLREEVKNMSEIMKEIWNEQKNLFSEDDYENGIDEAFVESLEGDIPMHVLTNHAKVNGAACILYEGVLEGFAKRTKSDFYVLPSSIHEVILIPATGKEEGGRFQDMVKEVNSTQVEEEEVLSDFVYYFSMEKGELCRI